MLFEEQGRAVLDSKDFKDFVTHIVTVKVVDRFETVKVKDHERARLGLAEFLYLCGPVGLVHKAGELVESRFFRERFDLSVVLDGVVDPSYKNVLVERLSYQVGRASLKSALLGFDVTVSRQNDDRSLVSFCLFLILP